MTRRKMTDIELREMAKDAERWRFIKDQFSPFSVNIEGNHAWQWRGNPERLRGYSISEAVDKAIESKKRGVL